VFVPWSWKDVAVYNRWWVSLWQNCLRITNAWLHDGVETFSWIVCLFVGD